MTQFFLFLVSGMTFFSSGAWADCDPGWTAYKDEFCVRFYNTHYNHDYANRVCAGQGTNESVASLAMIKDVYFQAFLTNLTKSSSYNIWIGGKYDGQTGGFKWDDGEPLTYKNWQDGYPSNTSNPDACMEFVKGTGKWTDVSCEKLNLVVCQKTVPWTLQKAVREIINNRREIQMISNRVVPVGSIYVEYNNQPSPPTLWPDLSWQDISDTYAGLFFRVSGGSSGNWGDVQPDCAPRITQMNATSRLDDPYSNPLVIPANGWSEYGNIGAHYLGGSIALNHEGASFHTEGCEVRPRNQAVRIWKRTG